MSFHLSWHFLARVKDSGCFFTTVDWGATRRERRGEDSAVGGGDPGERQGSAARPRSQPGAEAHGDAGLRGRRRSPALRSGGGLQESAVFRDNRHQPFLFSMSAFRRHRSGAAEGREGVRRGPSKSKSTRSSRQFRWGALSLLTRVLSRLPQINFLNSVIVDLQRKNEELKIKLKKLALAEFNGNDDGDGWGTSWPLLIPSYRERLKKRKNPIYEPAVLNTEHAFFQVCLRL